MSQNYLIIGDDHFIREKEIQKIRDKYLSSGDLELNYSTHTPDDADGLMNALGTMPFIADSRVILVKDVQNLSDSLMETLIAYLEKPFETSVLILTADGGLGKKKGGRAITKLLKVIKAEKPDEYTVKSWIHAFFKKEGIEYTPDVVDLIVGLKGTDTVAVKNELEKILAFTDGEKVTAEAVEVLVGRSVTETVFKLVDAINDANSEWAFRILNDLYDQKKQAPEIIGYLAWYMKVMQKIKLCTSRGLSPAAMASEVGYSPAYVGRLSGQAKKIPVAKLERWVGDIYTCDKDIKTGLKPAALAMDMLLVALLKK